ncbi:MAG: hypothetical protein ACE5KT_05800 [Methanosarcinales archaeon]
MSDEELNLFTKCPNKCPIYQKNKQDSIGNWQQNAIIQEVSVLIKADESARLGSNTLQLFAIFIIALRLRNK